jgi:hypothetical protein
MARGLMAVEAAHLAAGFTLTTLHGALGGLRLTCPLTGINERSVQTSVTVSERSLCSIGLIWSGRLRGAGAQVARS